MSPAMKIVAACACSLVGSMALGAPAQQIAIPGERVFPESITSDKSGAVIIGSLGTGAIYRARAGEATAQVWIDPAVSGLTAVTGVHADDRSNTLYVCSVTFPPGRAANGDREAVRAFNLKTGAAKASYPMPYGAKSFCNDITTDRHGTLYVADTIGAAIHRLVKGKSALEPWVQDAQLRGVDGIAVGSDGHVYANNVNAGKLYRIPVMRDGRAGAITELKTSLPLNGPDGLRAIGGNRFLQAEGVAGRIAVVTIKGDEATITPILEGEPGLAGVTAVKGKAWAVNAKIAQMRNAPSGGEVGPFSAVAIDIPR